MEKEFKIELTREIKKDLYWAKIKMAWYKKEARNPKHHGKAEALENLDIFTQRVELLNNKLRLIKEMFAVYEKK